jgi:hypothetical protein
MAIPDTLKTTAEYIDYLASKINLADKMWTHYGWVMSGAYADAYQLNKATLGKVKGALDRQSKDERAAMAFALSVLTVGVAGGVGGAVGRWLYENRDFQDAAKDTVKALVLRPPAMVIESLSPDSSVDAFAPGNITPEQYTSHLFEGISYNVALLTKILYELRWEPNVKDVRYAGQTITLRSGGEVSADAVKQLTKVIVDSSFMTEMPSLDIKKDVLTRKASLALWIGWALARDVSYWKNAPRSNDPDWHKHPPHAGNLGSMKPAFWEQYNWEPVRQQLISLGVAPSAITASIIMTDAGWGKSNMLKEFPGLYMWGFMEWASSPHAASLLFDNSLPKNAKGFELAKKQMSTQKLTREGWVYSPVKI